MEWKLFLQTRKVYSLLPRQGSDPADDSCRGLMHGSLVMAPTVGTDHHLRHIWESPQAPLPYPIFILATRELKWPNDK